MMRIFKLVEMPSDEPVNYVGIHPVRWHDRVEPQAGFREADIVNDAIEACWNFFDALYGAQHLQPIPYDSLPEDRQKLADAAIDALSKVIHNEQEA